MLDEIESKLNSIDWENPKITANETILKTIVEELLMLVVEETNEISDYRKFLLEKRKPRDNQLNKESVEEFSVEPSGNDYTERLKQLAQLVKGIHVIALQMKEERERAKDQHEATINQLLRENAFLKEQLDQKNRNEMNSPISTPVKSINRRNTVVKAKFVRRSPERQESQGKRDSEMF